MDYRKSTPKLCFFMFFVCEFFNNAPRPSTGPREHMFNLYERKKSNVGSTFSDKIYKRKEVIIIKVGWDFERAPTIPLMVRRESNLSVFPFP